MGTGKESFIGVGVGIGIGKRGFKGSNKVQTRLTALVQEGSNKVQGFNRGGAAGSKIQGESWGQGKSRVQNSDWEAGASEERGSHFN
jgi:hypothetical protein